MILPFASITWSRFNGSAALPHSTLSLCLRNQSAAGWLPMCQRETRAISRLRQGFESPRAERAGAWDVPARSRFDSSARPENVSVAAAGRDVPRSAKT